MSLFSEAVGKAIAPSVEQIFPKSGIGLYNESKERSMYNVKSVQDITAETQRKIKSFRGISDFKQNINQFMKQNWIVVCESLIRKFVQTAAIYSPPGKRGGRKLGSANIDEVYYWRPVYDLVQLSKGLCKTSKGRVLHATKEDYAALRNGYKYKIMNTKYRVKRGTVYAYAKSKSEAKRLSRIKNRGLAKYSWGTALNNITGRAIGAANRTGPSKKYVPKPQWYTHARGLYEVGLPPIFKRLEKKSPNLKKFKLGVVDYTERQQGSIHITVVNILAEIQKYGQIAIRQGALAVEKQWNAMHNLVQKGTAEAMEKMYDKFFKFELKKITEVEKVILRDKIK